MARSKKSAATDDGIKLFNPRLRASIENLVEDAASMEPSERIKALKLGVDFESMLQRIMRPEAGSDLFSPMDEEDD